MIIADQSMFDKTSVMFFLPITEMAVVCFLYLFSSKLAYRQPDPTNTHYTFLKDTTITMHYKYAIFFSLMCCVYIIDPRLSAVI